MGELRRCPFCGGEAKIVFAEEYKQWRIRCKNIDCDIRPSTSWFNNEEEAIDRWNRRKTIDEIVEQLEEKADEANNDWIAYGREDDYFDGKEDGIREAIEIVKGGAV